MDKICPIMSKEVFIDHETSSQLFVTCQKEKCQLWVGRGARDRTTEEREDNGHCGLVKP
jgi:hypothetical protein